MFQSAVFTSMLSLCCYFTLASSLGPAPAFAPPLMRGGVERGGTWACQLPARTLACATLHKQRCRFRSGLGVGPRTVLGAAAGDGGASVAGRSVGIDLGTTNSAVAVVVDGKPIIIRYALTARCVCACIRAGTWRAAEHDRGPETDPKTQNSNKLGASTTPSVVAFERGNGGEGDVLIKVGEEARQHADEDPANTFGSVKRLIGRSRNEASKAVADPAQLELLVEADDGNAHLECKALGRSLAPEEISCHIIRALVDDVERELGGEKVTRAVITVPAYFNDKQRRATEAAGLLAGLERVKLLREPEAAALAYGLDKREDELVLVFDLGGGTFDVSVLEVGGGIIEVLWTGGDAFLGGDDFDKVLAASILDEFVRDASDRAVASEATLARVPQSKEVRRRVLEATRAAKMRLSSARSASITVAEVLPGLSLNVSLTQKLLERRCQKLFDQLCAPVRQVALMAGIELLGDDTEMELSSGMGTSGAATDALFAADAGAVSAMDLQALKKQQKKGRSNSRSKSKLKAEFHRVQKQVGNTKLRPFPKGRALTEVVLVGGGTRMAAVPRLLRSLTGIEARRTIDPDEAVALGAAIQAGMMDGTIQGLEVLSPLQAALLRGFARKKLAEEQGTYKPLMGDPDNPDDADDADDWCVRVRVRVRVRVCVRVRVRVRVRLSLSLSLSLSLWYLSGFLPLSCPFPPVLPSPTSPSLTLSAKLRPGTRTKRTGSLKMTTYWTRMRSSRPLPLIRAGVP